MEPDQGTEPETAGWTLNTEHLNIRRALPCQKDVELLLRLWSDPVVMRAVGFPSGLKISFEEISRQLQKQGRSEFDCVLIVVSKSDHAPIGECRLGSPNADGVSETDIKLLPEVWGNGYGKELKAALVEYLFTHTSCQRVRATPNRGNVASIRMQESVGGRQTGEGVYQFPESMKSFTTEVPYLEYTVFREDWMKNRR